VAWSHVVEAAEGEGVGHGAAEPREPEYELRDEMVKYHVFGRDDGVDAAFVDDRRESVDAEEAAEGDSQERHDQQHRTHLAVGVIEGEESQADEKKHQRF
jgi:hypothetical protein